MTPEARDEISQLFLMFMRLYKLLAREALDASVRAWKMSPKFHLCQHACELQTHMNPRYCWTYSDEDLQGHVKLVAQSNHPTTVCHMTLHKWLCNTF